MRQRGPTSGRRRPITAKQRELAAVGADFLASQQPEWAEQYIDLSTLAAAALRVAAAEDRAAGGGVPAAAGLRPPLLGGAAEGACEEEEELAALWDVASAEARRAADFAESRQAALAARVAEIVAALEELDSSEREAGGGVVEVQFRKERKKLLKATRGCHHGVTLLGADCSQAHYPCLCFAFSLDDSCGWIERMVVVSSRCSCCQVTSP